MARARVFTKNVANYLSLGNSGLGTLLNGLAAFSVHAKIRLNSTTAGANDNNVLAAIANGTTSGFALCIDGTGPFLRISARSVSTDARQVKSGTTVLALNADLFVGGIVNIGGKTIEPYLNGVSEGVSGALTFANAAWTLGVPTDADTIGGFQAPPTTTPVQLDGLISEIAVWNVALSAANFVSLAGGADASGVAAANLVLYHQLRGLSSPETPQTGAPTGTITGTLPVYPPIERLTRGLRMVA